MIAWLAWVDWPMAYVLTAAVATGATAWLHEKREARAERRRNDEVAKLQADVESLQRARDEVSDWKNDVRRLEARVRDLETKTRGLDA